MKKYKPYCAQERAFLSMHYQTLTSAELAQELNRPLAGVAIVDKPGFYTRTKEQLHALRARRSRRATGWQRWEVNVLRTNRQNQTLDELSALIGRSKNSIRSQLARLTGPVQERSGHHTNAPF